MTPEERAQQTLENWACSEQLHFDEKEFWEDRMNHDPRETFLLNVAAQIRQAENAALERAAKVAERYIKSDGKTSDAIRALKHKDA